LNGILREYIDSVAYQEGPYTISMDLVNRIKAGIPDSFQYFVEDMFENITLYDNRIEATDYTMNADSSYTVDITAHVTKYRTDERGRQTFIDEKGDSLSLEIEGKRKPMLSYPLNDYIDVGIFAAGEEDGKSKEKVLYLQKHKISQIENKFTITVNERPKEVGIDPYNKLIDRNSDDNRRKVEEKKN
jgi:ABC-2 type transport system permease protein